MGLRMEPLDYAGFGYVIEGESWSLVELIPEDNNTRVTWIIHENHLNLDDADFRYYGVFNNRIEAEDVFRKLEAGRWAV